MASTGHSPDTGPAVLHGLSAIASQHDLLLCDVWGVIHNGVSRFSAATDALVSYRKNGGRVILVSNAPRPFGAVAAQLKSFLVPDDAYDAILTSGDVTQGLIRAKAGEKLLHIGPERDLSLFEGLDAPRTTLDDCHYAVCTGLLDDETQTAADYANQLGQMAARGLHMICANPDLVVDRGGRNIPCAGAIGAAYEALGGQVIYPGKPYSPIYVEALAMAGRLAGVDVPKDRVLAIGDAIRTDIAGAKAFGIASLMVMNGIHAHDVKQLDEKALIKWLSAQDHVPDFAMTDLVW